MLLQIDKSQLDTLGIYDDIKVKCMNCGNDFFVKKINLNTSNHKFCSKYCYFENLLCEVLRFFGNSGICPFYFLLHGSQDRKKNKRKRLSTFIIKELSRKFPDILITQTNDIQTEVVFDIYIPSLNLAFIFRKIYINENDYVIKEDIFKKINFCKSKNIKLFVFDIDEIGKFNIKRGLSVTSVIIDKIQYEINYKKLFPDVGNEQV